MTKLNYLLISGLVSVSFIGCSDNVEFVGATLSAKKTKNSKPESYELETYSMNEEEISLLKIKQNSIGENKTKVLFQVANKDGIPQKNISRDDLEVTENGVEVKNYTLTKETSVDREVDVVFAIDHTGSMGGEINAVKENVKIFYHGLRQRGVKANFCLVLYKDKITKKCDRIKSDDPRTRTNENLESFIDEVTAVKVAGGGHLKENTFGAVLTASEDTPWKDDNQKMIIALTDAEAWEARDHWGNHLEANYSPHYHEVIESLDRSKAQVFIIGPHFEGYTHGFGWNYSLPHHTGGQWYSMKKLRKGKVNLAEIFQYIQDHTATVHEINYVSQDNPGLDPTLALDERNIKIKVKKRNHSVLGVSPSSSMPNGAEPLPDSFLIDRDRDVRQNSVRAFINGHETSDYGVADRRIYFDEAPPEAANILVEYMYDKVIDNIDRTVLLPGREGLEVTEVYPYVNGFPVFGNHYSVVNSKSGDATLVIDEDAFSEDDPYEILSRKYIEAKVYYIIESK